VTVRQQFDRSLEDINAEISNLISQMTEQERREYLHESLFLNTVAYERQRVQAYVRSIKRTAPRAASAPEHRTGTRTLNPELEH